MFRTCTLQHSNGRRSSVNRTLSACAIRLANLAGTTEVFAENVLAVRETNDKFSVASRRVAHPLKKNIIPMLIKKLLHTYRTMEYSRPRRSFVYSVRSRYSTASSSVLPLANK